jgi:spore coat polysaccharide biosynthesis protein SpsF
MASLHGKPMILRQIERLGKSRLIDELVVATSVDPTDDSLVELLSSAGIQVRRGPLDDVVARFNAVLSDFPAQHIVRLTADCPLADPEVIDKVIGSHLSSNSDYSSNTLRLTYPDGLDAECVSADAFARLSAFDLTVREREHVTLGIYERPAQFSLNSVTQETNWSHLRWTVDVPDDLTFVRAIYDRLYDGDNDFGQESILRFLADYPELSRTDQDMVRNAGLGS